MASMSSIIPLLFLSLLLFFQVSIVQFSFDGSPLQSLHSFRGSRASWQQCHFEHLTALEPTHQVRSEAGFTEYYNTEERDEFQCAGMNVKHLIVESMGFGLPMYDNAHNLVYIVQGQGVYGMALPGCPGKFQSVRSPLEQRMAAVGEGQSTRKMWDEHQQLHQFRQDDVIAVPAGVAHWLYNNGDSAMVAFIVIDTNNNANQLNPRRSNDLLTPHWTMNAHTVMYVTADEGHVQVVDHHGRSVFDDQLRQQQILLIPQNFVVAVNALSQGFTWVSFKTNPNAIDSQIARKASVLGALPVDVVANSYKLSREDSRSLKFNRGDEMAIFVPRRGM